MTTAAEQYRALVARLESINPSEPVKEDGAYPAAPAEASPPTPAEASPPTPAEALAPAGATSDAPAGGSVDPDKYKPNDNIPVIKAGTLAQAKVVALKQLGPGKRFRFCMTYGTKLGPARPTPSGMEKPPDNFSQLGGANVVKPAPTYSGFYVPKTGEKR